LVRHGQTEWNLDKRFQGSKDSSLTDLGKSQARKLGEKLKDISWDAIYASPLGRAYATAEILRGDNGKGIVTMDGLKEMSFGNWEGRRYKEVGKGEPFRLEAFWQSPDTYTASSGENFHEVEARVRQALQEIIENHPSGNVLIVSHSIVVKLLMLHFEKRDMETLWNPPEIRPASLCKVTISKDQPEIRLYGDTSHY